jgi:hypothetical protein
LAADHLLSEHLPSRTQSLVYFVFSQFPFTENCLYFMGMENPWILTVEFLTYPPGIKRGWKIHHFI